MPSVMHEMALVDFAVWLIGTAYEGSTPIEVDSWQPGLLLSDAMDGIHLNEI